jgi:hypothetical protein
MDTEARLDLFATMEAFLVYVKSLHTTLGEVMADVAAIRNTVFDDPAEIAVYRSNLKAALDSAKPMMDEAIRSYDDLLEEFAASQQWKN